MPKSKLENDPAVAALLERHGDKIRKTAVADATRAIKSVTSAHVEHYIAQDQKSVVPVIKQHSADAVAAVKATNPAATA